MCRLLLEKPDVTGIDILNMLSHRILLSNKISAAVYLLLQYKEDHIRIPGILG